MPAEAQGLIVFPMYLFAESWREAKWKSAALFLSSIIAFKIYPALLAIGLLAERRFRDAALAIGTAAAITIFLFALYPGGILRTIAGFIHGVTRFSAPSVSGFTMYNYSALGLVAHITSELVSPNAPSLIWFTSYSWLLGIIYLFAVIFVVCARRLPFIVRLACATSVLAMAIPLSYGYSLVFVIVVIAELLRLASLEGPESQLPRPLAIALGLAVATTIIPWPFPMKVTHDSVGTVLVPASWIVLTMTALAYRYATPRRSPRLGIT